MMTSAQAVTMSVTTADNSPSKGHTHLDHQTTWSIILVSDNSNTFFPIR